MTNGQRRTRRCWKGRDDVADGFVYYENGYAIVKTPQKIRIVKYNKHPFADGKVIFEKSKRESEEMNYVDVRKG